MSEMEGVGGEHVELHPEAQPASNTPWLITRMATGLLMFISEYGWPCLLLGLAAVWLWRRYGGKVQQWQQRRQEQKEAAFYHKNPDLLLQREAAIESARLRMQQKYDEASQAHAEKMKLKEEQKRQERLAQQEKGYTLRSPGPSTSARDASGTCSLRPKSSGDGTKKKPSLRPEYNPLLGGGSYAGYRPPRRGGAAGGG